MTTTTTKRSSLVLALAVVSLLGLGAGACTAGEGQPLRTSANPAPTAAEPARADAAPADAAAPARPLDDEAVRALAEEVARLRADLADVTDELEQARAAGQVEADAATEQAPEPTLVTPLGVTPPGAGNPVSSDEGDWSGEPVVGDDRFPDELAVHNAGSAGTHVIEVPATERELVYVDDGLSYGDETVYSEPEIVVVQEEQPKVIYEQVVYEGETVYQWIDYGHVHHIGCGHHYYGCSCHPWYYSCGGGVSFHVSNSDWYGWVGFGNPYSYYNVGYWHGGYDYDYWCGYRRDYYSQHYGNNGHRDGARKRSKRSYRRGYQEGFESGDSTATGPGAHENGQGNVRTGDRTGSATAVTDNARRGSSQGRSTVSGSARPGGEDPSAGRTASRSSTPVVGDDRSRRSASIASPSTFRSAAERERVRREASARSISSTPERTRGDVTQAGRPTTTSTGAVRSRDVRGRRAATAGAAPGAEDGRRVTSRGTVIPSSARYRDRDGTESRGAAPSRTAQTRSTERRESAPSSAREAASRSAPSPGHSVRGAPDRGSYGRSTPQSSSPARSAPSRSAPARTAPSRSSSPPSSSVRPTSPSRSGATRTSPTRSNGARAGSGRNRGGQFGD